MSPHPDQLGFEWLDTSLDDVRTQPKKAPKRRSVAPTVTATATAPTPVPVAPAASVEDWALALEAHPDYKVLRRLRPCLSYGQPPQGAQIERVAILDTETTGLSVDVDRIIELALVVVDVDVSTGLPVGPVTVFDGLEDPGRALAPEIVALTGITDEMLRGKRLDEAELARALQGVSWVVAHNAGFDRPFVEARLPERFSGLPWACSFADMDWKSQGLGSAKLESLAQAAGWFYDAHRADADCHALLAVLARPYAQGLTGLAHLWQQTQHIQYRLAAVGAPFESKDALKARGYRWDSVARVWSTRLASDAALAQERQWLATHVYANGFAPVRIEAQDALTRYAKRTGSVRVEPLLD
jgi:DNA polymerase III subunit epsilon